MRRGIVIVLSGFPRRSETFALHEISALEARGAVAAVFATKPGDGLPPHPGSERLLERVRYLPPGTVTEQAEALVQQLQGYSIQGIHGYFAHTPTEVAEHAARRLGVPFGFSMHARDARKVSREELARRAQAAACVIACNSDVAQTLDGSGVAVQRLPHGVDTERFRPEPVPPGTTLRLLAVGRLVEKKGFDVLVHAAAQLSVPFHLRIIGHGPQENQLAETIERLGLAERVELCGSVTHADLPAAYAAAHIVVAPSVIDQSRDRDGVPNVVLEAMASGRAVVASNVGAISSAIVSGESGILVPPGDATLLASVLERLAADPSLRERLGHTARMRAERDFDLRTCTRRFCQFLESIYCV